MSGGAGGGSSSTAGKDVPGVIARPPLIYLATIVAGYLLGRVWAPPPLPAGLEPLGWALIAGALLLMLWAAQEFRKAGTSFHPTEPDTAVISTGPYRLTRNPLYIGLTSITAGVALLQSHAWVLVLLVPTLLVMHHGVIVREERYLERKFGAVYTDYKARVRRWI
jgi:protein-S-isoprenylcysteine O-methyltransferase Ste14